MTQEEAPHSWLPQDFSEQVNLACRILRFAFQNQTSDLQQELTLAKEQLQVNQAKVNQGEAEIAELEQELKRLQTEVQSEEDEEKALNKEMETLTEEISELEGFRGKVIDVVGPVDSVPKSPEQRRRSIYDLRLTPKSSHTPDSSIESSLGRRHGKLREIFEVLRVKLPDASFSACLSEIKAYSKGEKSKTEVLARLKDVLRDEMSVYTAVATVL